MPNTMEHERMRFRTMNERQLQVRLNKITDRVKLNNFIQACREWRYENLRRVAEVKLSGLSSGLSNRDWELRNSIVGYGESPASRSRNIVNNYRSSRPHDVGAVNVTQNEREPNPNLRELKEIHSDVRVIKIRKRRGGE